MCRSYFFAFLACALFSLGALCNAYHNLPQEDFSQISKEFLRGAYSASQPDSGTARQEEAGSASHMVAGDAETNSLPAATAHTSENNNEAVFTDASGQGSGGADSETASSTTSGKQVSADAGAVSLGLSQAGFSGDGASEFSEQPDAPGGNLNALTDNFNILFLGVDGKKLEMVCVYSINHHLENRLKSVSLFFPVNSVLTYKGREKTLEGIFAMGGWKGVAEASGNAMGININHYVKIDRQALRDLEKYFEPIYVDGVKVQMETLFVRRTSDKDDRIIARILRQVLRPEVFFRYIPGLVLGIHGDIESNFSFAPKDLAFYYRIAKKLSTKKIEKVVLSGTTQWQKGRKVNIPPEKVMENAIYRSTKQ